MRRVFTRIDCSAKSEVEKKRRGKRTGGKKASSCTEARILLVVDDGRRSRHREDSPRKIADRLSLDEGNRRDPCSFSFPPPSRASRDAE